MNLTVPEVAAVVYDDSFAGTGNWPFNTAFAGSFPGMRSYVTRLDDIVGGGRLDRRGNSRDSFRALGLVAAGSTAG